MKQCEINLGILGLGYVGLPLAIEFAKQRNVVAYDINKNRIKELELNYDSTNESTYEELASAKFLKLSNNLDDLKLCNIYILTVPTPIDEKNNPDLSAIIEVTKSVSKILKKNDIVIYESTVYPGLTEEICVPILESESSLKYNKDFFCGYSPERINPGDRSHRLVDIVKVTSGSNKKTSKIVDDLYKSIITAGTHQARSIKVAEAAKVIENTQRDLNIALMNELSIIFNKMGIDTSEVIEAASTKWNFIPFMPGLVGGHCIGVDPYYLTYKAKELGYDPKIILSGRELNDGMVNYIIDVISKKSLADLNKKLDKISILILGLTFKENCPDIRNSKTIELANKLESIVSKIHCHDPLIDADNLNNDSINLINSPEKNFYDVIILSVPHKKYINAGYKSIREFGLEKHIFLDLKSVFNKDESDFRL